MRKITQESISAFMAGYEFMKSNTAVTVKDNIVTLELHGNGIASYVMDKFGSTLEVCDGGWQTHTTKERLNGIPNVRVQQKKGVWYLNGEEWDGSPTHVLS